MPELPEVNTYQRYFDASVLNQRIEDVEVYDDKIIRNLDGEEFARRLRGRTFTGSTRRGKYLFGHLDNGHYLQLHFGMTGELFYYAVEAARPSYERFAFSFANGFRLGFDCSRKFARVLYIEDLDAYLRDSGLGEDALLISKEEFLRLAKGKKGTLKGFLLNQRYIAGVGNLYADEICYQARIHPASRMDRLNIDQLGILFAKMKEILQFAVDREAHYGAYPEYWLWQWRRKGATGPENSRVLTTRIAGRTTYYCEGRQPLYR